ncbi:hypothetical protein FRB94_010750 [Tulasnella sp. JGI-2019a]|nr:hypothetical protein FRB94_010750 [Tulasnella sp. JGI-2019a]KAG9012333.1 hypothetical protein FRB93_001755 [Tulasnella sp. JGI-2019a]KAG9036165.1 hypothetical protein FRB95_009739 [Tulasnella sp. JGI-2019a]
MSTINDLIIQLQLCRDQAPAGMIPVQAAMYLAVAFGRPQDQVFGDKELITCPAFLDHAAFIRTTRRLLPLDEDGTRAGYPGSADREDLRALLTAFGRDPIEVDEFMSESVPETQVNLNKFLRILAKPIAGQRYSIGVYTVSRPLGGGPPIKMYTPQFSSRVVRKDRSRPAPGMPMPRDSVAMSLARRVKYQKYRASIQRLRARRNSESDATSVSSADDGEGLELSKLTMRLCGLTV